MNDPDWTPVTHDRCDHVTGPFYHGTAHRLEIGDHLVTGRASNFEVGRFSNHLYFTRVLETAVWGAELATALTGSLGPGHVYRVEPVGTFEDDPNVTNKRFPGNPTQSYRTRDALRVVAEVDGWTPHPPDVLQKMLVALEALRGTPGGAIDD